MTTNVRTEFSDSAERLLAALGLVLLLGPLSGPGPSAQTSPESSSQPLSVAPVNAGGQLFKTHCATCHGATARGDGPTAAAMRKPPPDLTSFAIRNGGGFPSERLRRIIDGRGIPSHGNREMPVWGIELRTARAGGRYDSFEERIDALVRYLQSIQERNAQ